MIMKCEDCRFFKRNAVPEWNWLGECTLKLPSFVAKLHETLREDGRDLVRYDDGCDLGKETEESE